MHTLHFSDQLIHLQDTFEENDEEYDNKESNNDDTSSFVTVLDDLAKVEIEVQEDNAWDLGLSLSTVANVIADSTVLTGAHILEFQDIWIVDTGATSHISKHAGGK
jgi:hypothetical protein